MEIRSRTKMLLKILVWVLLPKTSQCIDTRIHGGKKRINDWNGLGSGLVKIIRTANTVN